MFVAMHTLTLGGAAIAIQLERCREMPGAINQAHRMWRILVQYGHARIVEELRNDDAFGQ